LLRLGYRPEGILARPKVKQISKRSINSEHYQRLVVFLLTNGGPQASRVSKYKKETPIIGYP
jgi:hypothetical protein